jgi:hypothetical protein
VTIGDTMAVTLKDRKIVGEYLGCQITDLDRPDPILHISTIGWIERSDILSLTQATEVEIVLWKLENA